MFLLRTTVKNFKGLGEFTIDWLQHNNLIGLNKAGKTCVLDSITDAFSRLGMKKLPNPINNNGATAASYEHEIGEFDGETKLKVKRIYRQHGDPKLIIEPEPPDKMTAQQVLDLIWYDSARLDIAQLKAMSAKDWMDKILSMMGISKQLADLDREYQQAYDARHDAKRDMDTAVKRVPDKRPEKVVAVDTNKVRQQLNDARKRQDKYQDASSRYTQIQTTISDKEAMIKKLQQEISELNELGEKELAAFTEYSDAPGVVSNLEQQLADAEQTNQAAREYGQYDQFKKDAETQTAVWQELDDKVKSIPEKRKKLFSDNKCPIEGITLDDEGMILYDGIPVVQINEGTRILLGAEIELTQLPKQQITMSDDTVVDGVRTILIENGSLADDSNTRQRIRELCEQHGVQDVFELVLNEVWDEEKQCLVPDYDTAEHMGIVIKEGAIYAKED